MRRRRQADRIVWMLTFARSRIPRWPPQHWPQMRQPCARSQRALARALVHRDPLAPAARVPARSRFRATGSQAELTIRARDSAPAARIPSTHNGATHLRTPRRQRLASRLAAWLADPVAARARSIHCVSKKNRAPNSTTTRDGFHRSALLTIRTAREESQ